MAVLALWLRTQIGFEKLEVQSLVTSAHAATVRTGRLNLFVDGSGFKAFSSVLYVCLFRNANEKYHKTCCLHSRSLLGRGPATMGVAMQNKWSLRQDALG